MFVCVRARMRACVCVSGRQQTVICDDKTKTHTLMHSHQIPRSFLLWLLSAYNLMLPNAAPDYVLKHLCVAVYLGMEVCAHPVCCLKQT
jgi:hypothetical protein